MGRGVETLTLCGGSDDLEGLKRVVEDVMGAARVSAYRLEAREGIDEGSFEACDAVFAPKPPKASKTL